MAILDYFRKVPEMTVQEVRDFVDGHERDAVNLVDVRTPKEYDRGHLPGAVLIPVRELSGRTDELDPSRTTITYCGAGIRSRAAASVLRRAGFEDVFSMSGGMKAWEGSVSDVRPEVGMAWFAPAGNVEQTIALAYIMEQGTREFYTRLGRFLARDEEGGMFTGMAAAEAGHCDTLETLYREISGDEDAHGFPYSALEQTPGRQVVEGGMFLEDAVQWARGRDIWDVLEFAAGMEANAYDIYLHAVREADDEAVRRVFDVLCKAEKTHLDEVSARLTAFA